MPWQYRHHADDGLEVAMADDTRINESLTTKTMIVEAFRADAPTEPDWQYERVGANRWRWFVYAARAWSAGKHPCECCTPQSQATCGDCMGTGRVLIAPRVSFVPGLIEIENSIAQLADIVGDFDA